jgi:hypothetical protein
VHCAIVTACACDIPFFNTNTVVEEDEMVKACSIHGREEKCIQSLVGKLEGERPLGRPRCIWKVILKWILKEYDGLMWTGIIWLRIGISGRLL